MILVHEADVRHTGHGVDDLDLTPYPHQARCLTKVRSAQASLGLTQLEARHNADFDMLPDPKRATPLLGQPHLTWRFWRQKAYSHRVYATAEP